MPTAFDEAFRRVKQLVADFRANESFYLSAQFSEAQTRKDFIDKFFIALGWDVNHETQNSVVNFNLSTGGKLDAKLVETSRAW